MTPLDAPTPTASWRCWLTGCMAVVLLAAHDLQRRLQPAGSQASRYDLDETLRRLESQARLNGLSIFARLGLDQRADGASTRLLVLGPSPDATPVIQTSPNAPINLPLTVCVEQQRQGGVLVHLPRRLSLERFDASLDLLRSAALLPGVVDRALA